jgi:peptide/nickel transport system permease protein
MKRLELYLGSAIVLTVTAMAVTSLFWTPFSTTVLGEHPRFLPPGWPHVLGTDSFGSDTFSLLLVGARVVLMVGVIAVGIAAVFGVPLGIAASHAPAWASEVLMRATDVAYAFPALLLAILLAGVFGGSTVTAMTAIGVATIPQFVRVTRAGALQVYASDFVLAARACGTGRLAIARQHVLPNIAPLIGVQASVSFAMAILAEAALSYLGLGTQPPTPTWGRMLHEAQAVLIVHPLQAVWPGLAVVLAVLGFNLLGDGLRDLLDPRLREVA